MAITINNNSPRVQYPASSGQTNFAGTWRIEEETDIKVYLTPVGNAPDDTTDILVLTTDYTITGTGVGNSFTVILNVGATTDDVITILDDINFSAIYNFLTNQNFSPAAFNEIFSKWDRELKQLRMETGKLQVKYQDSEQVIAKDYKLPQLAARESWRMDQTNTEIEAVVIGDVLPGETWYAVTTGVNTYLATITDFVGYTTGEKIHLNFGSNNTGASTININGLGAKNLVNSNSIALNSGDLVAGVTYSFLYHDNEYYLLGLSQKATVPDVDGGTDNFKYVTPFTLAQRFSKIIPSGVIVPFGGLSSPSEWLVCDGTAISRTTYADLFAAIGIQWGVGDGSTTFNIPDLRNRCVIGGGTRVVGNTGGAETHQLTIAELAAHLHGSAFSSTASGLYGNFAATTDKDYNVSTTTTQSTKNSSTTGSNTAHNNMQPFGVGLWIIKI